MDDFRALAENSPDIIDRFNRDLRHLYVNPAGLRLHGLPARRVIGRTIRQTGLAEPYCSLWEDRIREVFASAQAIDVTDSFPAPGGLRYFESRCVPEFGPDGGIRTVLVISRDVTGRRRAENELREREADLEEAQRVARIGSWRFDIRSGQVRWSEELFRIFGVDRDQSDVSYELFVSRIHPDDRSRVLRSNAQARKFAKPFQLEYRIVMPDGTVKHVREIGYGRRDERGRPAHLFGTAQDVTDRRQAEEALRVSEARFRGIFENAGIGIGMTDLDGRLIMVNAALARMLGYSSDELLAMSVNDITHPADLQLEQPLVREVVAGRRSGYEIQKRYQRKDGTLVWVDLHCTLIHDARGRPVCAVATIQDVTRNKHAEAVLQKARNDLEVRVKERTAKLRKLAAELTRAEHRERRRIADILHDDLQQHLVGMQCRIAGRKHGSRYRLTNGDVEWLLDELAETLSLSRGLTTRLRPPVLYELGLQAALEWLADDMKDRLGLTVTVKGSPSFHLHSDEMRVFAFGAVTELLTNVAKHAGVRAAQVRLRWQGKRWIRIEVVDKGVGFDAAQPTQETKFGIFSIRERTDAMGGRFEVISQPGKGTCAALMLPAGHGGKGWRTGAGPERVETEDRAWTA